MYFLPLTGIVRNWSFECENKMPWIDTEWGDTGRGELLKQPGSGIY